MAQITGSQNEKVFTLSQWRGLNEAPDGDTHLKMGEASKMINWRITRDGNLKRRPGLDFLVGLCSSYSVDQSFNVSPLGTFSSDDEIVVYTAKSAMSPPGTITLGSAGQIVERGRFFTDGTVTDGVFTVDDGLIPSISNGVLSFGDDSEKLTFSQFETALAELDEDEFLYAYVEEVPYAFNSSVLTRDGDNYLLGGYRLRAVASSDNQPIVCLWSGLVVGKKTLLAACNGGLWNLYNEETGVFSRSFIGSIDTSKNVSIIPFDGKAYVLDGTNYYCYDGTTFAVVDGYRPLVAIAISPILNGGGSESGETTGEYVNRLNGKRRVWISPDGNNKKFQLPETNLASIDWVRDLNTNTNLIITTNYTVDLATGQVTFVSTPPKGVNSYEIAYSIHEYAVPVGTTYYSDAALTTSAGTTASNYRGDYYSSSGNVAIAFNISSTTYYAKVETCETMRTQVTNNQFAELFAGNTDTGIFIYGDGTNRALYTGMDYDGMPRVDYFPDQYEVHVGDSNTPITAMIRHYGVLMCYKTDSAWALSYGSTTLANDIATIAVYCTPVNRDKGNVAMGQVCLVDNNPVTCSGTELYQWINSSYYTSNLTRDERQARRISDRVQASVKELDFNRCCLWDDNDNQEFYISGHGMALVWNYAVDVWYRYENFDAVRMCNFLGELYIGTSDGKILRLTDSKNGDEGVAIKAEWESGAMDFGAGYQRKYSSTLWVGLKPVAGTSVDVCVETDRKNTFNDKVVSSDKAKVAGQPFMNKTKLKAKKFVYYRLMLSVDNKQPPVTVTDIEIRVRSTGYAK